MSLLNLRYENHNCCSICASCKCDPLIGENCRRIEWRLILGLYNLLLGTKVHIWVIIMVGLFYWIGMIGSYYGIYDIIQTWYEYYERSCQLWFMTWLLIWIEYDFWIWHENSMWFKNVSCFERNFYCFHFVPGGEFSNHDFAKKWSTYINESYLLFWNIYIHETHNLFLTGQI